MDKDGTMQKNRGQDNKKAQYKKLGSLIFVTIQIYWCLPSRFLAITSRLSPFSRSNTIK